jgi:hypothetical protein
VRVVATSRGLGIFNHSGRAGKLAARPVSALMLWYTRRTLEGIRLVPMPLFPSLWTDTMNRCIESRVRTALLACAVLAGLTFLPLPDAAAQGFVREAPKDVVRGRLTVTQPPEITLDGKPDRLSPGARIRGTNNLLVLSGSIVGQSLPVVYRRDAAGLVHEVWVLTPQEDEKLAGVNSLTGYQRFNELLALIFGTRP